jgi:CD109 antigen
MFIIGESGIYWSNVDLPSNRVAFVAFTERLSAKYESELEAHAIASTAFALLTYMLRAQTSSGKPIVNWLQTRRNFASGWCSSYDSFFAFKATTYYAIRHGDTIEKYNLRVNISSSDNVFKILEPIIITDENIIDVQTTAIENVYGRVLLDAYGTGYALIQVRYMNNAFEHRSIVSQ